MRTTIRSIFLVLLFFTLAACSLPPFLPDVSYAARLIDTMSLESNFVLRGVDSGVLNRGYQPFYTYHSPYSGYNQLFLTIPQGFDWVRIVQADGSNANLQVTGEDPFEISYDINEFEQTLEQGFLDGGLGAQWDFFGITGEGSDFGLRFTGAVPISREGLGDGLLLVRRNFDGETGGWAVSPVVASDASVSGDQYQPLRPFVPAGAQRWTFFQPLLPFAAEYPGEGFDGSSAALLGVDAEDPESGSFGYLMFYYRNGAVYEALQQYTFDFSVPAAASFALDPPFLETKIEFSLDEFDGTNPRYSREGLYHRGPDGDVPRSYLSVVELERAEYATFGWDRGQAAPGGMIESSLEAIADDEGPIPGRLLTVLSDGTLWFLTDEGMWVFYREGDASRLVQNPGLLEFLREYRDVRDGIYMLSFRALFSGGDEDNLVLQSRNYSIPTADFLEIMGY